MNNAKFSLPMLYRQNDAGKLLVWSVEVSENVVSCTFGQLDGKLQTTEDVISGKNIGKSNETTPEEQARLKAQQLYDKKVKKGYTPDKALAQSTKNVLDAVKPMLAYPIEKKEKHVKFPCYMQPKLDGTRMICIKKDGKAKLYTRSQKEILTLPHIVAAVEALEVEDIVFDGELYNHDFKNDFNSLISIIKRDDVHENHEAVQYHIYDVVSKENYLDRFSSLALIEKTIGFSDPLCLVKTILILNEDEMEQVYNRFVDDGYEGAMYRGLDKPYEHKRSTQLLKIKEMQDDEFEIIGVLEGNGKLMGHAGSFVCKTKDGKEFRAKLKGELDGLKEYFVNFDKYKGKMLTVQFQDYTPEGKPRFPVGLRIRDYE